MKNLVLLALTISYINSYAQNRKFPDGIYLSISQLQNKTPAFNTYLNVGIYNGQSMLSSTIDSLNKKYIRNKVIAYVRNDSIFLNTSVHPLLQHRFFIIDHYWNISCIPSENDAPGDQQVQPERLYNKQYNWL
jgi:hypothetical protein